MNIQKQLICEKCESVYKHQSSLYKHKKKCIPGFPFISQNGNMKCHYCGEGFSFTQYYRNHLKIKHKLNLEEEILKFKKEKDFIDWKYKTEHELNASYVKRNGVYKSQGKTMVYYRCCRTGTFEQKGPTEVGVKKKQMKSQGSKKINNHCPSMIIVKISQDCWDVTFHRTHIGHNNASIEDLKHIPISKIDKKYIAGQLLLGASYDDILNNVRSSFDGECKRIHLLSKKQISRIGTTLDLNGDIQRDPNDLESVALWVQQSISQEDNPVILFKNQVYDESTLQIENFNLGIMKPSQGALLKKFGPGGTICLYSTRCDNPYSFMLISVLVIDELGEGVPVAFYYTKKDDEVTLKQFIMAIKEKVGSIKAETFISENAPQYYNGWSSVMDNHPRKQLCSWVLNRMWQDKLNFITDKRLVATIFKEIKNIQFEKEKEAFYASMKKLVFELLNNKITKKFGNYFSLEFAPRPELWAYCFGVQKNNHLISMQRAINYVFMKGFKLERLDESIHAVMNFIKSKLSERVRKLTEGKNFLKTSDISARHLSAMQMSCDVTEHEDVWSVVSKKDASDSHVVKNNIFNPCNNEDCSMLCQECECCVHKYTCSCDDSVYMSAMCKHIHVACMHMHESRVQLLDIVESIDIEEVSTTEEDNLNFRTLSTPNNVMYVQTLPTSNDNILHIQTSPSDNNTLYIQTLPTSSDNTMYVQTPPSPNNTYYVQTSPTPNNSFQIQEECVQSDNSQHQTQSTFDNSNTIVETTMIDAPPHTVCTNPPKLRYVIIKKSPKK